MKFIHTAVWHLGKLFYGIYLTEEQEWLLEHQFIPLVDEEKPDVILLSGDVYDRSVPPAEAVDLFNHVISEICGRRHIPMVVISGNHDSAERIAFGGRLMRESGVYVAPAYSGNTDSIVLTDEWGPVNIYLLPFVKPVNVKHFFEEEQVENYTDALRVAVEQMNIFLKRNRWKTIQMLCALQWSR